MRFKQFLNEYGPANNYYVDYGLDCLKLALDTWGFEHTTGWIGDAASGTISLGQAIHKGATGKPGASKHLADFAISAISMIPFADVIKLLKIKYGTKYAMLASKKLAHPIKNTTAAAKTNMANSRMMSVAQPWT